MKKLVILSDYGLDDACASVFLLSRRAKFSGIDIVAIGGNTSAENSFNNAKKLLYNFAQESGVGKLEGVRLVDTCAVGQPICTLPKIHGEDGMGDLFTDAPEVPVAVISFDEFLQGLNNDIILFSVGPCTVTKMILQKIGACELVIMAGVLDEKPNYEDMEFNQGLDAEAFNFCVKYPHVIATLDSCRIQAFNLATKPIREDGLLNKFIIKAKELAIARHPDNCYIYDYIASRYLISPDVFSVKKRVDKWGNTLYNLEAEEAFCDLANCESDKG